MVIDFQTVSSPIRIIEDYLEDRFHLGMFIGMITLALSEKFSSSGKVFTCVRNEQTKKHRLRQNMNRPDCSDDESLQRFSQNNVAVHNYSILIMVILDIIV